MTTPQTRVFEGILDRQIPWRSLSAGSFIAAVVHVLLMAAAAITPRSSARPLNDARDKLTVVLFEPQPQVRAPLANSATAATSATAPGPVTPAARPSDAPRLPSHPPHKLIARPHVGRSALPPTAATPHVPGDPTANLPNRDPEPLQPSAASLPVAAVTNPNVQRSNDVSVLPFMDGMTRPTLVSKVDPEFTREAREANVRGLMLAKCIITTRGTLEHCRILKGIPAMDRAVLTALASWRYTPVLYRGKPTAVEYVIPIRLSAP